MKESSRFHLFRPEEKGLPLKIYEPLLLRSRKLLVDCLLRNQAGKEDRHISLTKCAEHIFLISGERMSVR